ncbi:MAG: lysophospholipid acyltransferase family protein [Victivallaceae bacterium]
MRQRLLHHEIKQLMKANLPLPLATVLHPILYNALKIGPIDRIYDNACQLTVDEYFAKNVLATMNVELTYSDEQLMNIPKTGPLLLVSNHPYGGIEGVALLTLLQKVRPDVKLLANQMLGRVPLLCDNLLLVNPFGGKVGARESVGGILAALRYLKDGHVLGVFPAGEVSSYQPESGLILDGHWSDTVGMLVRKAKCDAICVYFEGHNSNFFQTMGRIHPRLRTMLLPREFLRCRNKPLSLKISQVIPATKCAEFESSAKLMDYLRSQTYQLSSDNKKPQSNP